MRLGLRCATILVTGLLVVGPARPSLGLGWHKGRTQGFSYSYTGSAAGLALMPQAVGFGYSAAPAFAAPAFAAPALAAPAFAAPVAAYGYGYAPMAGFGAGAAPLGACASSFGVDPQAAAGQALFDWSSIARNLFCLSCQAVCGRSGRGFDTSMTQTMPTQTIEVVIRCADSGRDRTGPDETIELEPVIEWRPRRVQASPLAADQAAPARARVSEDHESRLRSVEERLARIEGTMARIEAYLHAHPPSRQAPVPAPLPFPEDDDSE